MQCTRLRKAHRTADSDSRLCSICTSSGLASRLGAFDTVAGVDGQARLVPAAAAAPPPLLSLRRTGAGAKLRKDAVAATLWPARCFWLGGSAILASARLGWVRSAGLVLRGAPREPSLEQAALGRCSAPFCAGGGALALCRGAWVICASRGGICATAGALEDKVDAAAATAGCCGAKLVWVSSFSGGGACTTMPASPARCWAVAAPLAALPPGAPPADASKPSHRTRRSLKGSRPAAALSCPGQLWNRRLRMAAFCARASASWKRAEA